MTRAQNYLTTVLTLCCWLSLSAYAGDATTLKTALSETGRHQLSLAVSSSESEQTFIPITVITGKKEGPTLLVLSGVHGSEYAPIAATQRLAQQLEPATISGKVIFVHIANMPAYLGRTIYTSPVDQKNLNRLFPGKSDGTLSDRIAFTLTNQVYPLADAVLDMHSGDGNEDLSPNWVGYYGNAGNKSVIAKSRAMAFAFGFEHIVEFQWQLGETSDAIWAGSAAVALGIPSIDVEAGGKNVVDLEIVSAIETGIRRTLAHLKMISDDFPAIEQQTVITDRTWIAAPQDGTWVGIKQAGTRVTEGELIGYLTDFHGRRVLEARAPHDGLLLLTLTAPPVREGETLAIIAKL